MIQCNDCKLYKPESMVSPKFICQRCWGEQLLVGPQSSAHPDRSIIACFTCATSFQRVDPGNRQPSRYALTDYPGWDKCPACGWSDLRHPPAVTDSTYLAAWYADVFPKVLELARRRRGALPRMWDHLNVWFDPVGLRWCCEHVRGNRWMGMARDDPFRKKEDTRTLHGAGGVLVVPEWVGRGGEAEIANG